MSNGTQGELALHEVRCPILLTVIDEMDWRYRDPRASEELKRIAESCFLYQDHEDSHARAEFLAGRRYERLMSTNELIGVAKFNIRIRAKTSDQARLLFQMLLHVNRNTRIEETRFFGRLHGTVSGDMYRNRSNRR